MNKRIKKPTIGVYPKKLFLEQRIEVLGEAINRKIARQLTIPKIWVEEYNNRLNEYHKTKI